MNPTGRGGFPGGAVVVCGLLAGLVWSAAACASSPPGYRPGKRPHGELRQIGPVWALLLEGSPEQRGQAAASCSGRRSVGCCRAT